MAPTILRVQKINFVKVLEIQLTQNDYGQDLLEYPVLLHHPWMIMKIYMIIEMYLWIQITKKRAVMTPIGTQIK